MSFLAIRCDCGQSKQKKESVPAQRSRPNLQIHIPLITPTYLYDHFCNDHHTKVPPISSFFEFRHDHAPSFVPRSPKTINRTTKRQLPISFIFPNPIHRLRKKIDGRSDNARICVARQFLRDRIRLQKIEEVHTVAETFNIVASHKFQALCNLIGILATPHEQQPQRKVNVHLHTAPLRYPKFELPLDSRAAWKLLKKQQVAGYISKQRFRLLLRRRINSLATS